MLHRSGISAVSYWAAQIWQPPQITRCVYQGLISTEEIWFLAGQGRFCPPFWVHGDKIIIRENIGCGEAGQVTIMHGKVMSDRLDRAKGILGNIRGRGGWMAELEHIFLICCSGQIDNQRNWETYISLASSLVVLISSKWTDTTCKALKLIPPGCGWLGHSILSGC